MTLVGIVRVSGTPNDGTTEAKFIKLCYFQYKIENFSLIVILQAVVLECNTGMRRITTFRSTTDRIYDGDPIIL